jgi:hypothetical protein
LHFSHADEARTVFITGFPEDVRERELNNMLRFLPGYEVGASCSTPNNTSLANAGMRLCWFMVAQAQ